MGRQINEFEGPRIFGLEVSRWAHYPDTRKAVRCSWASSNGKCRITIRHEQYTRSYSDGGHPHVGRHAIVCAVFRVAHLHGWSHAAPAISTVSVDQRPRVDSLFRVGSCLLAENERGEKGTLCGGQPFAHFFPDWTRKRRRRQRADRVALVGRYGYLLYQIRDPTWEI